MKSLLTVCTLVLLFTTNTHADALTFVSHFNGDGPPWNWDSYAGAPTGTDQLVVYYGDPPTNIGYVTHDIDNSGGSATGRCTITFDVDMKEMGFVGYYTGPKILEIGTVDGNKSVFGDGCMVGVNAANWKADPGTNGQYRFGYSTYFRYWNGTSQTSGTFTPPDGIPHVYHVQLDVDVSNITSYWEVVAQLTVIGPSSGGAIITSTPPVSTASRNDSSYDGLQDITKYRFGSLDTANVYSNSTIRLDNFVANIPEPTLAGLALLMAVLTRRVLH